MNFVAASLCGIVLCAGLSAQTLTTYRIDTLAGGGTPGGEAAKSAGFFDISSLAVDSAGNVYFETGQIILRLNIDGTLTHIAGNGVIGNGGDDGPATHAQIGNQGWIAVDANGGVYFSDWAAGRVRKIAKGMIATIAGGGEQTGDNVPATQAHLSNPQGIAVDPQGNIYVSDSGTDTIRRISNGIITTIAGNGSPGFSGDGGPAGSAQLTSPGALAVDTLSNLYVADLGNNRIRRIAGDGTISTVAGTGSVNYGAPTGDNGPATDADIYMTTLAGITTDASGSLYFVSNNAIRKVVNGVITTIAGVLQPGSTGSLGDGGPATQGVLNLPSGLAVDNAGNIYVGSHGNSFDDARIREVAQGIITTAAGGGFEVGDSGPATAAQLNGPGGLALDTEDNLYIADGNNNRVRLVSDSTITTVAGNGSSFPLNSGDGGPATDATLSGPTELFIDKSGNLFISDSATTVIRKVVNGVINTVAGQGAQASELNNDEVFVVGGDGTIYTADFFDEVIHKISYGIVTTVAGNGTAGYSGDHGPATSAQLFAPRGLALDSAGNLYIADSHNGAIRKVSDGIITTVVSGLGLPQAITFDSAGSLYICDEYVVWKVTAGVKTIIAGGGSSSGDGGPATLARLNAPGGIAVDALGRVYVSESGNNRVRVLTPLQDVCASVGGPVEDSLPPPCSRNPRGR